MIPRKASPDRHPPAKEVLAKARFNDRFVVRQCVGAGAMGSVYWAYDEHAGMLVALKIGGSGDEKLRARFRREAALQRLITHPSIPVVVAAGETTERPYIAFPFIRGLTLEEVAEDRPNCRLSPGHAAWVTIEVCKALGAVHEAKIVHRDVKPGNVMLSSDGELFLIDFGLSIAPGAVGRLEDIKPNGDGGDNEHLTDPGNALGTPAYMSPEQAVGWARGEVTAASDVYSTGCMLYALLTGVPPFEAPDSERAMRAHVEKNVPDPRRIVPGTPKALAEAVRQATARRPEDRFKSAEDLARFIQRRVRPQPIIAAPVIRTLPGCKLGSTVDESAA